MVVKCGEVNRHQNPMQILADFQGKQFRYRRKDQDMMFSNLLRLGAFRHGRDLPIQTKENLISMGRLVFLKRP